MSLTADDYREMYERERELRRQEQQGQMEAYRERHRVREAEHQERLRTAEDWDDAWLKAVHLLEMEAREEAAYNDIETANGHPERNITFFQDELEMTLRALALYRDRSQAIQVLARQIREQAEHEIAELEQSVLTAVAAQLKAMDTSAGQSIVQALEEDNPQILLEW